MNMQKGMAVIERDDVKTSAIFFDHEVVEFARFAAQTKKNIAKAEAEQREAERNRRKAEKAKARRRAYTLNTFGYVLIRGGVSVVAALAGMAGLIHPAIYIPVIVACLCAACLRMGLWFGRMVK